MQDEVQERRRFVVMMAAFAAVKIAFHLLAAGLGPYGYFRDEFYYLDCAANLSWGYVDQPPFSLAVLQLFRTLLGESVWAIRLPAILAEAATLVLAGVIAREMGGRRFAQFLACASLLVAPVFLTMSSFFSMNALDHLFWALAAWLLVRIINTGDGRLWLWFGVVAGLGLQNKYSIGFFGGLMAAALLLTPERRFYRDWRLWAGGGIAFILFLPHLVWQQWHGWPTLEFMHDTNAYKNVPLTPGKYLTGQLLFMGPLAAPVWIGGVVCALFFSTRRYRIFAFIYLGMLAVFYVSNGKSYYLAPIYPVLLALGGVCWEHLTERRRWIGWILAGLVLASGAALAPHAMPLLPPERLIAYQGAMGLKAPQQEVAHSGVLPQHIGDRLGWLEYAAMVAKAFHALPAEDQTRCALLVSNYGEAGALNLSQQDLGLPRRAISGYMNYYLWGPGDWDGQVALVYWPERELLDELFDSVTEVDRFSDPYVMARQNDRPLYLCRGLKVPVDEAWPRFKRYY
ncbi:MAG: phospholipid carrier-dependent glycosyltransferase [Candidatus Hydrogenedens sp.]|nr:phospholipid carrier-dependent glycosyltransferase [Candidatus Hydrogenedens sp.]